MPTLLQINIFNKYSTGKIAEQIGSLAIKHGWNSYFAYSRGSSESESEIIRIGNNMNVYWHVLETRLFDNHGLASRLATKKFLKQIEKISPDIIHLHNIHGYYLNYKILFDFLRSYHRPIVWTLHDCWPITGHCSYFTLANCNRWKTQCFDCPLKKDYPGSIMLDHSQKNLQIKKSAFTSIENLHIVSVSNWLNEIIKNSFLSYANLYVIHNGIDISNFSPCVKSVNGKKFRILGVSNVWSERKGLNDFFKLREQLSDDYNILLVGLSKKQLKNLPAGITGIDRTESQSELAKLYGESDVFVNTTYADNFPTVNIEALASGTPVITYQTGGSPEAVDEKTGIIVPQGNISELVDAIKSLRLHPLKSSDCRERAEKLYNKDIAFQKYIELYDSILAKRY